MAINELAEKYTLELKIKEIMDKYDDLTVCGGESEEQYNHIKKSLREMYYLGWMGHSDIEEQDK